MDYQELAEKTKRRIAFCEHALPQEELICKVRGISSKLPFPLESAIPCDRFRIIGSVCGQNAAHAESSSCIPSPIDCVSAYQRSAVAAVRVFTDPIVGKSCDAELQNIRKITTLPLIQQDFIITSYQIYYAKLLGANAVELISAIMTTETLNRFIALAHSLNLSAIVHVYSKQTLSMALDAGARMICIDTVNPRTGVRDESNIERLRAEIPTQIPVLVEQVQETPENLKTLRKIGVNAVMLGDRFMRARSKSHYLSALGFTKN